MSEQEDGYGNSVHSKFVKALVDAQACGLRIYCCPPNKMLTKPTPFSSQKTATKIFHGANALREFLLP
jgi:hypothetical protein